MLTIDVPSPSDKIPNLVQDHGKAGMGPNFSREDHGHGSQFTASEVVYIKRLAQAIKILVEGV